MPGPWGGGGAVGGGGGGGGNGPGGGRRRPDARERQGNEEIIRRWSKIHPNSLIMNYVKTLEIGEGLKVSQTAKKYTPPNTQPAKKTITIVIVILVIMVTCDHYN